MTGAAEKAPHDWPAESRFALAVGAVCGASQVADDDARRSDWVARVCHCVALDPQALPSEVTKADAARSASSIPAELHLQVVTALLLVSLGLDKASTEKAKPEDERRYGAHDRARVFATAEALAVPVRVVHEAETAVAEQLYRVMQEAKKAEQARPDTTSAIAAAASRSKLWRQVATGAGFVVGGVALGLTGGLAAPLIAPLLVTLTGGALGFLASSGGAVAIGLLFGVGGGGLSAYRAQSRVADIDQFEFEQLDRSEGGDRPPALTATILCSGLLLREDDYIEPWRPAFVGSHALRDTWAVKAETAFFLEQGKALESWLKNKVISKGVSEVIKRTALNAFFSAVALPSTVYKTGTMLIDNTWQRSVDKANKIGDLLADVIEAEVQGRRPCILVGSGTGALSVFRCLVALDARGKRDLVVDAHLVSLPRSPGDESWAAARRAVARRLTNAYSSNDWVLALVARLHSLSYNVAGLAPVGKPGVEDVDIGDLLEGHLNLREALPSILARVDLGR